MSSVRTSSLAELICDEDEDEDDIRRKKRLAYFASNTTLQENSRVLVYKFQLLKNPDALFIVRDKLQILIGDGKLEVCDA